MKYFLIFLMVLTVIPLNAQNIKFGRYASPYLFDTYDFSVEDFMNPAQSFRLNSLLHAKYVESEKAQSFPENAPGADKVRSFLQDYDAKIKAAGKNKSYQSDLSALKKKPTPYKRLEVTSYGTVPQADAFVKHLMNLRNKFWDRTAKLKLVPPSSAYPEKYRSIFSDENASGKILREYYRYANQCVYRSLNLEICSYVVSSRADNMLSIAEASLKVEDMPVFYGAMAELSEILYKHIRKDSIKYIFSNSKDLGI